MPIRSLKELTNVYHQVVCSFLLCPLHTSSFSLLQRIHIFGCLGCQTVGRNGVLEMDFAIDRTGRVNAKHAARCFLLSTRNFTCITVQNELTVICHISELYIIVCSPSLDLQVQAIW